MEIRWEEKKMRDSTPDFHLEVNKNSTLSKNLWKICYYCKLEIITRPVVQQGMAGKSGGCHNHHMHDRPTLTK